ncbi:hypothetical protein CLF_109006 [Clonorchis sinensis]|uniref:Uncharacterized protein n=1 Tax=Clonorchis sinensis TaxID=79923 RepID=G7YIT7_CLOSI|nr:hypothetical protein CLF_109006 [Clonorchis sinensis]
MGKGEGIEGDSFDAETQQASSPVLRADALISSDGHSMSSEATREIVYSQTRGQQTLTAMLRSRLLEYGEKRKREAEHFSSLPGHPFIHQPAITGDTYTDCNTPP